jgi:uncharacterized membrane protein
MGMFIVSVICLSLFFVPVACVFGYMGLDKMVLIVIVCWLVLALVLAHSASQSTP